MAGRVLGVALDASGKWTGLYRGLAERYEIVGVVRPQLSRAATAVEILANWRINLRERALAQGWSARAFDGRTRVVDRALRGHAPESYDVIVQTQMLNGLEPPRPYTVYTDSTHALNQRFRFGGDPTPGRLGERLQAREKAVVRGAAHVFTMSAFARGSVIEDYGCEPERVTVVGAGANLEVAAEDPAARDRPRAILVGFELERKGGHEVLAAWPAVRAAVPDAELLIVGPPPGEALPGVRWAGPVRERSELSALYRSATVFVLPTLWDPWGLVYHEAMAHGLPCIGTDRFAVPEIIAAGETGLLVPPRDTDAVGAALIELLGDPGRAAEMGREARRRVLEEANWSAVAARMAPHLDAVISASG